MVLPIRESSSENGHGSAADQAFDVAMEKATEVGKQARSIKEQIKPYTETDDPLGAIVEARERSLLFEDEQERWIFLGPA